MSALSCSFHFCSCAHRPRHPRQRPRRRTHALAHRVQQQQLTLTQLTHSAPDGNYTTAPRLSSSWHPPQPIPHRFAIQPPIVAAGHTAPHLISLVSLIVCVVKLTSQLRGRQLFPPERARARRCVKRPSKRNSYTINERHSLKLVHDSLPRREETSSVSTTDEENTLRPSSRTQTRGRPTRRVPRG